MNGSAITAFVRDTWPYLLLFAFGILLLTHHNDLDVGLQSRVGAGSKGMFALGEDAQRILGCIAVFVAAWKISKREKSR